MLPEIEVAEKDILAIVNDLSDTSKAFAQLKKLYFNSPNESLLRKIASEVE
jgi:hypothetical protein